MGDVYRLQIWETVEATARAFPYEGSMAGARGIHRQDKSNLEHLARDNKHLRRENMPLYENIR